MGKPAKSERVKEKSVMAALAGILLLNSAAALSQPVDQCKTFGTPQVSPLISLEIDTTSSLYRRGRRIHVTLRLKSGSNGVYLPNFFGDFQRTCNYGFTAEILTKEGKTAGANAAGCGYAGPPPEVAYLKLNTGEIRTWTIDLSTKSIAPGNYCLYAEYLSPEHLISTGATLPEDEALVAKGHITAAPLSIQVR